MLANDESIKLWSMEGHWLHSATIQRKISADDVYQRPWSASRTDGRTAAVGPSKISVGTFTGREAGGRWVTEQDWKCYVHQIYRQRSWWQRGPTEAAVKGHRVDLKRQTGCGEEEKHKTVVGEMQGELQVSYSFLFSTTGATARIGRSESSDCCLPNSPAESTRVFVRRYRKKKAEVG